MLSPAHCIHPLTTSSAAAAAAKEVSDKVKAAAAARAAAMAAADEAPALSETAVATAQRDIAALLQPGESVTAGLRRLGAARRGAAPGKGEQLWHCQSWQRRLLSGA
jgi:hypothetical protein